MATPIHETRNHTFTAWHSQFLKYHTASSLIVQQWTTGTVYGLVGAMLSAIIAAVTYECLHEYLRYLRHKALTKTKGAECCGSVVFTCWEKFILSIVQMIRVTTGYFMMLCVMTMNIWILVAVLVGAGVGYGVGKPLVANAIRDIVTSHGYKIARVDQAAPTSKSTRPSQRSSSWRYQPIGVNDNYDGGLTNFRMGIEDRTGQNSNNRNKINLDKQARDDNAEIIWIRRSFAELESMGSEVFSSEPEKKFNKPALKANQPEVQLRQHNESLPSTSIEADDSSSSLNLSSRFRSTSKTINDSFRSEGDGSLRSVTIRADSYTLDYDSIDRRKRTKSKRKSSKSLDRNLSDPTSRFKSISRQISRQQSFNTESFELG